MDTLVELLLFCICFALQVYVALSLAVGEAFVQAGQWFSEFATQVVDDLVTKVLIPGAFLLALGLAVVALVWWWWRRRPRTAEQLA